eukprot:TRINITY_DN930_c0_g1_i2.p2 TRINITY_DN930_c0_g1~~TRINITY_DN930_c0_g1_i2.p2  ORF type:complete len:363 (-),score=108.39 TRINITY_DN930_c0_g1_i2:377-1465(-)
MTDWLTQAGKKRKAEVLLGSSSSNSNSSSTSGSAKQPVAVRELQVWRSVPKSLLPADFDASKYRVGSLGDIWSFKRSKPKQLQPTSNGAKSYLQVTLTDGRVFPIQIHKLVGTAFKGDKPGEGYDIDHIDGNRHNNRADNLEWKVQEENGAKGGGVLPKVKTAIQLAYTWVAPTRQEIRAAEWAAIPKYTELEVSNTGYIRRKSTGDVLKTQCSASGHLHVKAKVTVKVDGVDMKKQPDIAIHRAVYEAFVGDLLDTKLYVIDHHDHDPWNNAKDNLKQITHKENSQRRTKLAAHNTSGTPGVSFCNTRGKWKACITVDGWLIRQRRFSTKAEAVAHRDALEREFGYGKYAASAMVRTEPVV